MTNEVKTCGVIILAAGQSRRLGRPKQLLRYEGTTLIGKVARLVCDTAFQPLVCVLGSKADQIEKELDLLPIQVIHNPDWPDGMASSIRKGLAAILEGYPDIDGVLVLVCDQPFLDRQILDSILAEQRRSGFPAVAAAYDGRLGTPALFRRDLFPRLMKLEGDKGARLLLEELGAQVGVVAFGAGSVDIDTDEDYNQLMKQDIRNNDH